MRWAFCSPSTRTLAPHPAPLPRTLDLSQPVERPTRATRAILTTSADEFANAAGSAIGTAVAGGAPISLLAVKVDVTPVAGENGQSAAVREQIVELIRRNLRGHDVVAHTSAEEVLVLLHGAAREQGNHVASRLCAATIPGAAVGSSFSPTS